MGGCRGDVCGGWGWGWGGGRYGRGHDLEGGGGEGGEGAWCSSPFSFFLKGYVIVYVTVQLRHLFFSTEEGDYIAKALDLFVFFFFDFVILLTV